MDKRNEPLDYGVYKLRCLKECSYGDDDLISWTEGKEYEMEFEIDDYLSIKSDHAIFHPFYSQMENFLTHFIILEKSFYRYKFVFVDE